jgi:hypothetical protein
LKRFLSLLISFSKILVILVLTAFNSTICHSNIKEDFTVRFSKLVKVSDSTRISVKSDDSLSNTYEFRWQANFGVIDSSGGEVMYYAPDSIGEAIVELDIYNQSDFISKHTFNISIFRQLIILKADDLIYDKKKILSDNWTRFLHYVVSGKIKSSVGLIGNSLETEDERYFHLLKYLNRTGVIELWNHGYDHLLDAHDLSGELYDEFRNKSLEYQKEQLRKTHELTKEKLDLTIRTFGAPGNAIDSITILALDAFDEIKVWFFGLDGSGKLVLRRNAEIEFPTGNPNYNSFIQNYDSSKDYLVFQIHPNQWDENQFNSFKEIISYLRTRHVTFILPYEYYNSVITQTLN